MFRKKTTQKNTRHISVHGKAISRQSQKNQSRRVDYSSTRWLAIVRQPLGIVGIVFVVTAVIVTGFLLRDRGLILGQYESIEIDLPEFYTETISISKGEQSLKIQPLSGERVAVEQDGATYVYRETYPNTDVIQTKYTYKIKEELRFRAPGHPMVFTYSLTGFENYVVEIDKQGNYVFHDKAQHTPEDGFSPLTRVFTLPRPFIEDTTGERSYDAVTMRIDENILSISIDPEWVAAASYPLILDPTIEIDVLNVQSHPQQGDDWQVFFTTAGVADLYIIPDDQATIDDDIFTSLACGDDEREPEILADDVIFYENWSCADVANVVHYTAVAGKHTLRFEFVDPHDPENNATAYAYNDPGDPWYGSGYGYRKEITIASSQIDYTGTFPVLVTTTDAVLAHTGSGGKVEDSGGLDITFADDTGTLLDFEREYYDSSTGQLVAWVEASVNASADTSIYIYYGKASATDESDAAGTWDSNYMMVQHFDESSGTHLDSTSNNNDSTGVTVTTQGGTSIGKIGPADDFDGVNDVVTIADSATLDIANAGTIEAWISTDTVTALAGPVSDWRDDLDDPDGSSDSEYSGFDMTIVGDVIYYGAAMCGPGTFEYATSTLSGDLLTWSTGTAVAGCAPDEGYDIDVESDGDYIWYAALGNNGSVATFQYATSTLDQSSFSSWITPGSPTGVGGSDGSGIDMTIVGGVVYFSAVLANGATEDFEFATINLDGSSWSGWDEATAPAPDGANGNEGCSVGMDSNGLDLYYAVLCRDDTTSTYQSATSTLDGSTFNSWSDDNDPADSGASEKNFNDVVLVGDQLYHTAHMSDGATHNYQVASSTLSGSAFSTWISEQDGSGLPAEGGAGDYSTAAVVSDGKTIYYGALGTNSATEGFLLASSTVTAHPFVAKAGAYEVIQSGGGYVFDWSGSPKSFGTSTPVSTFTHVAVTHDGSTMTYYINGQAKRTQTVTADFANSAAELLLGSVTRDDGTSAWFDGVIDEVRVSNTARSSTWLTTQYNNQTNVDDFMTFGTEETNNAVELEQTSYRWFENGIDVEFGTVGRIADDTGNGQFGFVMDDEFYYMGGSSDTTDWLVHKRLLRDGSYDPNFDDDGQLTTGGSTIYKMTDDENYIYVTGSAANFQTAKIAKSDGTIAWTQTGAGASSLARGIAVDDDFVYIGGQTDGNDWYIEKRAIDDGELCTAAECGTEFGTGGIITGDSASDRIFDVKADDTYVYFFGRDSSTDFRIEKRLKTTGALDSGFGTSGVVTGDSSSTQILDAFIDDTHMWVAGSEGSSDWRIEKRLISDGSLVSAFGTSGIVSGDSATNQIWDIDVDTHYIYAAGDANSDWRIEKRSKVTGDLVSSFGTSGVVASDSASTVARGIGVTNSALFIAGTENASGQDWQSERRYVSDGSLYATTTALGLPLDTQNTAVTLTSDGQQFRLRQLLHISSTAMTVSSTAFTLQFAEKGGAGSCSAVSSGSFADVTTATAIAYYNSNTSVDGETTYGTSTDPTNGTATTTAQTYEELNDYTAANKQIEAGYNGLWDFSLYDNTAPDGTTYCFRTIKSDDTSLDTYTYYPELTTYTVITNNQPSITSVNDAPDPVPANQAVYWNVDWSDVDASDLIKVVVCKDNVITTSTLACVGGTWCESPVFTNRDPEGLCNYETTTSDIGANTYYAYVCDNSGEATNACSNPTSGTFTVEDQDPTAPTNLLLERYQSPAFNIATDTPRFSAIFNDPNIQDIADRYCIQVNTQSDFLGTDVWTSDGDSCGTGTAMNNCTQGEQCTDLYFKGTPLSIDQTVYYWHIIYWDDAGNKGATSTTVNFTMSNGANGKPRDTRLQGGRINGGTRLQ